MGLQEETKKSLERNIGLPYEQIVALSPFEADAHVESITGKKLSFSKKSDSRKTVPGNPLLSRKHLRIMEEIGAKFEDALCEQR